MAMNGELASVAAARIVRVADKDSSWHMLSGELACFGSFVVVVGVVIISFGQLIQCHPLLQLGAATSLCPYEIGAEMQPRLEPEHHCQL
ncbi:hypothetical protein L195_g061502 [Trifolium pratense]|uniref:Uncharacterized protein n=1 Tax=Trifolium pratense TaxID=57577 RepID=A0A2K3KA57_TRIPR|nr:hypothetical protein L195_g061502 [Trifolium pratense]